MSNCLSLIRKLREDQAVLTATVASSKQDLNVLSLTVEKLVHKVDLIGTKLGVIDISSSASVTV